jgi:anti-sigma regulatory factor (Ser/Thr protein kinase)
MRKPLKVELPRHRSCAGLARRFVEQHVVDEVEDEALDSVKLVVSELVDNAYTHGEGRMWLRLEQREDRLRVEVIDEGHAAPIRVQPTGSAGGGLGLSIVEKLAVAWGAHDGTTHVWAELPLSAAR